MCDIIYTHSSATTHTHTHTETITHHYSLPNSSDTLFACVYNGKPDK